MSRSAAYASKALPTTVAVRGTSTMATPFTCNRIRMRARGSRTWRSRTTLSTNFNGLSWVTLNAGERSPGINAVTISNNVFDSDAKLIGHCAALGMVCTAAMISIHGANYNPGLHPDTVWIVNNTITNPVSCGVYVNGGQNMRISGNPNFGTDRSQRVNMGTNRITAAPGGMATKLR